jgi:hypothetical protein
MKYPLPRAPALIEMSLDFEEHEARIFAGLNIKEYDELPGTMQWCDEVHPVSKCEVLVLFRLHNQMAAVRDHLTVKKRR